MRKICVASVALIKYWLIRHVFHPCCDHVGFCHTFLMYSAVSSSIVLGRDSVRHNFVSVNFIITTTSWYIFDLAILNE